jgi:ABC-type lipoprotein release transport system permease subunit
VLASLPKLAWRNLGRNRRRTLITGTALAFGISLCVAAYGLVDGLSAQMLHTLTKLDLGHVQIHDPDYAKRRSIRERITDTKAVLAAADATEGVTGAAPRAFAFALVSTDTKSSGIELVGIDPEREPRVTELGDYMKRGTYLLPTPTPWPEGRELTEEEKAKDEELTKAAEDEALAEIDALDDLDSSEEEEPPPKRDRKADRELSRELARTISPPPKEPLRVMLGTRLARALDVDVGGEVYASTVRLDGLSEAVFMQVIGIYETGTQQYDRYRIYMHIDDLRHLVHLGDGCHEVAIVTDPVERAPEVAATLQKKLGDGLLVRPWNEVRPDMQRMLDINEVSTDLMVFIIFIVATLGVINTMLMSVFERTRELGVLKAIGMSGGRILSLIIAETVLLVGAASIVGTALGLGADLYMARYGVDLSGSTQGISMGGIGIRPIIYGEITARGVIMPSIILSISCLVASLYPALRAARLRPAIGMRET